MTRSAIAKIFRPTKRNLSFLARKLRAGDLVAVPSETVYGLAGNALDAAACRAIFRAKGRPSSDPLIVHLYSASQLATVAKPNKAALLLAKAFWPGPLTIILPKQSIIPGIVTAGRKTVAVRVPAHPVFRQLLKEAGIPLAAPSANPFGYISPTTAEHVREGLGERIAYIVDGGPTPLGLESTIVDLRRPVRPVVLRPGLISATEISRVLGRRVATHRPVISSSSPSSQLSPGLLKRHYSPRTPLILHSKLSATISRSPREALLFFRKQPGSTPNAFYLARRGNVQGAARRLFATLRSLDARKFSRIHVELAPSGSLGDAINDRLRRAAAR